MDNKQETVNHSRLMGFIDLLTRANYQVNVENYKATFSIKINGTSSLLELTAPREATEVFTYIKIKNQFLKYSWQI